MKRIFYLLLVAGTAALFSISSCKKEPLSPVPASTGNSPGPAIYIADLRADNWVKDANGFYIHTFQNIIYRGASVKVYLLIDGKEEQIIQYIPFMGGQLWSSAYDSDVKIYYRCNGPLPFTSLNIKVTIG